MTPEEVGWKVFADALDPDGLALNPTIDAFYVQLEEAVSAAIRAAVAAEREACAAIADAEAESAGRVFGEARDAAFNIAVAIRARGE